MTLLNQTPMAKREHLFIREDYFRDAGLRIVTAITDLDSDRDETFLGRDGYLHQGQRRMHACALPGAGAVPDRDDRPRRG